MARGYFLTLAGAGGNLPEPYRELQGLRERETGRFVGSTVAQRAGVRYTKRRHSLAGQIYAQKSRKCASEFPKRGNLVH